MITIDPYEMRLRYTYDLRKWMGINETITAAHYDYHTSEYHLFFNDNQYRTWKVNVSLQNSLPMSWVCVCVCGDDNGGAHAAEVNVLTSLCTNLGSGIPAWRT